MSMLFKRFKDWATSITAFRTGDVIPVDGPSGTAKMTKGNLLKETAQNALAGNMAQAFDPTRTSENPYKAGESVSYDGKTYTFMVEHYGAWNAADMVNDDLFDLYGTDNNDCVKSENPKLLFYVVGKKTAVDGTFVIDDNYTIKAYDVSSSEVVRIVARIGSSTYIVFEDASGSVISTIQGRDTTNPGNNFEDYFDVPSGAVRLIVPFGIRSENPICESLNSAETGLKESSVVARKNFQNLTGTDLKSIRRNTVVVSDGSYVISYTRLYDTLVLAVTGVSYIVVTARKTINYSIVFKDGDGVVVGHYEGSTEVDMNSANPNIINERISVPSGTELIEIPYSRQAPLEVYSNLGILARVGVIKDSYEAPELLEHLPGKVIRTNGNIEDVSSYDTNVYDVSRLTSFHVFGKIGSNTCILFFNATGNILSYVRGRSTFNVYVPNFDDDIVIPANAVTMKLSYGNNVDFYVDNGLFKNRVDNLANRLNLFGKKVCFIGSSSTEGTGATDGQNFVNVFSNMTGANVVNLGNAGTCVANNTKNGRSSDRFVTRATPANIGDADLVVVQIANNDLSYDSKAIGPHFAITALTPSGNIGDKQLGPITDTDTFAGALHDLITTIQTNVPDGTPIVFITPHHVNKALSTNPNSLQCNSNGDFAGDFVDAIKDICAFYAVPVLDMYAMGSMSALTANYSYLFSDGLHFNNKGHYILARLLVNFVKENVVFIE